MARIKTFDDWVEIMRIWQKDLDVDPEIFTRVLGGYNLEAKYGDLRSNEIEFGEFAGQRKWDKVMQIPDQRMRDAVLNMIIYQGDTEFASNEQQRLLFASRRRNTTCTPLPRVHRRDAAWLSDVPPARQSFRQ